MIRSPSNFEQQYCGKTLTFAISDLSDQYNNLLNIEKYNRTIGIFEHADAIATGKVILGNEMRREEVVSLFASGHVVVRENLRRIFLLTLRCGTFGKKQMETS